MIYLQRQGNSWKLCEHDSTVTISADAAEKMIEAGMPVRQDDGTIPEMGPNVLWAAFCELSNHFIHLPKKAWGLIGKPQPQIHPRLEPLLDGVKKARKIVESAERDLSRAEGALNEALLDLIRNKQVEVKHRYAEDCYHHATESIAIGGWNCPNSPTGTCIYDEDNDVCHDCCLFCGEPEERK